ncbi:advillin-like [Mytilus californianus]|uniref:advillin-like n=1 Tax=Mytilus californianus TaxID=6549 RepID=UPI002246B987|nr:advillin-like [Mytilus californianus]
MGTVDKAFLKAGQGPGLEIWRIEKMKVILQEPKTYGEFYTGDSYILLHTKKNIKSEKLEWNIHFWLGNDTSQDEMGVAAYKTVELDDYLGGAPVQHREVQDHESKLFLSYFTKGIRYLTGGVDSGFRQVQRGKFEKRLFQIKGKRNVRVKQVECSSKSMNQGDVFLLDCGLTLHLWNGPQSSTFERMKGHQVAKNIRDEERGGKAEIRIIDIRWNSDIKFFADLGSKTDIAESSTAGDDKEFEKKLISEIKLYSVSDASGKMEIAEKSRKPFHQTDLDSNDCFILDAGPSGIFVWVGRKCTNDEKKSAWKYATDFLEMKGYPNWTAITRIVESGETPVFKQYFTSWIDHNDQKGLGNVYNVGNIAEIKEEEAIDYCKLHERKQSIEENDSINNVQTKIWKIENGGVRLLQNCPFTVLSSSSCYIIIATFSINLKKYTHAYYWQGTRSSTDDKTASAIYTKRLCEETENEMIEQIRIEQGKEPDTLMKILDGKLVITMNEDSTGKDKQMYHIRGTTSHNTKAIEVEFGSKSLNSYDVFLVLSKAVLYIWIGKISIGTELHAAMTLATYLSPESSINTIQESEETEEFWDVLGGKDLYAQGTRKKRKEMNNQNLVRLFSCSNTTGMFKVTEIVNFTQQDLLEDDVMLLDAFDKIFVWVGRGANRLERKKALETALKYLTSDPFGRTEGNTRLFQIKQGYEPSTFTSHFHGWDHNCWRSGIYKKESMNLDTKTEQITTVQEELEKLDQNYSHEQLLLKRLPEGVDSTCKEKYLTDDEFLRIFGMSKVVFASKPKWKQLDLKKRVGLF